MWNETEAVQARAARYVQRIAELEQQIATLTAERDKLLAVKDAGARLAHYNPGYAELCGWNAALAALGDEHAGV